MQGVVSVGCLGKLYINKHIYEFILSPDSRRLKVKVFHRVRPSHVLYTAGLRGYANGFGEL